MSSISVVLIGKEINRNDIFKDYILRHLKKTTHRIPLLCEIDDYYKIDILEFIKKQKSSQIYIFASGSSFNLFSKVISSELKCATALKDGVLIPDNCISSILRSYVVEIFDKKINILFSEYQKKLPPVLLETKSIEKKFHIFGFDSGMLKVILEPIASIYNIKFDIHEIVPQWHRVYAYSNFSNIADFIKASEELLSHQIIEEDDVMSYVIKKFSNKNLYISCAESCTGGLLSSYFTKYPSISNIYELGVVSYSNEIKSEMLNVSKDNLFQKGAVSREVVQDMLNGILKISMADYVIAISGIAGPDGGSESKPVGSVYIGVGNKDSFDVQLYHFDGDREYIQEQSKLMAIKMLILFAKKDLF